jgi:hypothetical protein
MIEYTFFRLVHCRASKRKRERKRNGKRSPRFRCDTQSYAPKSLEVVGRVCWYRMPLSHVFVLRWFEDTRESNYGHPSFLSASSLRWIPRQDNSRGWFYFSKLGDRLHVPAELSQLECSSELIMQKNQMGRESILNQRRWDVRTWRKDLAQITFTLDTCVVGSKWIRYLFSNFAAQLNSRIWFLKRLWRTKRFNKAQTSDVSSNLRVDYNEKYSIICIQRAVL